MAVSQWNYGFETYKSAEDGLSNREHEAKMIRMLKDDASRKPSMKKGIGKYIGVGAGVGGLAGLAMSEGKGKYGLIGAGVGAALGTGLKALGTKNEKEQVAWAKDRLSDKKLKKYIRDDLRREKKSLKEV